MAGRHPVGLAAIWNVAMEMAAIAYRLLPLGMAWQEAEWNGRARAMLSLGLGEDE